MQTDIRRVPTRLNIGCGQARIEGYINIDLEEFDNVDLVLDIRKSALPFKDSSVDEILLFHTIEHIEYKYHKYIFKEFWRLLQDDGMLYLSYPEFKICAQYYIDNHRGMQDFWRNTLYGLQRTPGDYHVTLMDTDWLCCDLHDCGYYNIAYMPERTEEWNTILRAQKCGAQTPPDERYEENLSKI